MGHDSGWWAAAGTWLAALGTVGVSVWLLAYASRDRRSASSRQARAVAAWQEAIAVTGEPAWIRVRVHNGSDLPVYKVTLRIATGIRGTFVRRRQVLTPGETREWTLKLPGYPHHTENPVDLMFEDAARRQWVREDAGVLRRRRRLEQDFEPDPAGYPDDHPTLEPDPNDHDGIMGRRVFD